MYQTVFEKTRTAFVAVDEDSALISFLNAKFEKLSGYTREEIQGKMKFIEFVAESDRQRMLAYHQQMLSGSNDVPDEYGFRFVDRYGNEKNLMLNIVVVPEVRRNILSIWDISSILRTELEKLQTVICERSKELEAKTRKLDELNTTLKVLLQQRDEDRKNLEEKFLSNIKKLILPYTNILKRTKLDEHQFSHIAIIEQHLKEISSPLMTNMQQYNFTPTEIKVATLIKDGKTTKEIAKMLGVASSSINTHRNNIRKKLNLKNRVALQSRLRTINEE